jgi:hypothetical protein
MPAAAAEEEEPLNCWDVIRFWVSQHPARQADPLYTRPARSRTAVCYSRLKSGREGGRGGWVVGWVGRCDHNNKKQSEFLWLGPAQTTTRDATITADNSRA